MEGPGPFDGLRAQGWTRPPSTGSGRRDGSRPYDCYERYGSTFTTVTLIDLPLGAT